MAQNARKTNRSFFPHAAFYELFMLLIFVE
jgi:hypothetical protein